MKLRDEIKRAQDRYLARRESLKDYLKTKAPAELHAQRMRTKEERARRAIDIMTGHQKEYMEQAERREVSDKEARAIVTNIARRHDEHGGK
jgi:predicted  nucleic acid-binding Zn-ribbon protein